jgi:hypothetical protein
VKGLTGKALTAVRRFLAKFPEATITSGKRSVPEQARAMAKNVTKNRNWIAETYKQPLCKAARLCHELALKHKDAGMGELSWMFANVLLALHPHELAKLSRHYVGLAFDVQPVPGARGGEMKAELRALAAELGGKFLDREGGREIWHLQFDPEDA